MAEEEKEKKYIYRKEFVAELAWRTGLPLDQAGSVTQTLLDILTDRFCSNQAVSFEGFGVFEVHPTVERMGRNPKTKEEHVIPARFKPIFRPSRILLDSVTQSIQEGTRPVPRQNLIHEEEEEPAVRRRGRPRKKIPAPAGYAKAEVYEPVPESVEEDPIPDLSRSAI